MFGSYSEVRSNTSIAIENSLRHSISPSIVRFTMCVRNRHNRTDETKPGLFTTRANWSRTALAGTGWAAELARDFPEDKGGVGTCFSPHSLCSTRLRGITASLRRLTANCRPEALAWKSGSVTEPMQTYKRAGIVIFVSNRSPEATIVQDIEGHGLSVQWAPSISAAVKLLDSACEKTVVATELALADG